MIERLVFFIALCTLAQAETYSIVADRYYRTFSHQNPVLKRIKPGFFNPPGGRPIFVPGMQWQSVLLIGRSENSGPPAVARMAWWTTTKPTARRNGCQSW